MDGKAEEWRPVVGWSNYEVSNLGRVRSLRYWDGRKWVERVKILRLVPQSNGYVHVTLCNQGKQMGVGVHTLVLAAFVGPHGVGEEARHFPDPDRANNGLENLSWAKKWVNEQDKTVQGMKQRRLTREEMSEIFVMRNSGMTQRAIASKIGVSQPTISGLLTGLYWKEITGIQRE